MDDKSLEQIYEQFKKPIYQLCRKLAENQSIADELFSQTWSVAAEKFYQIDQEKNVQNWLYTVCLNIFRKGKIKRKFLSFFSENSDYQNIATENKNAETEIIKNEETFTLQNALNSLPEKYKIPLVLLYYEDLSYQNISEIMKIPMSTVKFRIYQAKKLLRNELEKKL